MNKKTLFVIGNGVYPHVVGGMEIFNYYLLRSIRHRVRIACFAAREYDFDGIEYIKSFNLKPSKFLFPMQLFFCLLIHRFDKIVFSYSAAHWIIWWAFTKIAVLFKIPYVVVIHFGKKPPIRRIGVYRDFFSSAQHVIAVSDDIKRNFDNQYGISCEVIPPLVPFEEAKGDKIMFRKKYNLPKEATIICMVGSIKAMKNPDTLLDAIKMFETDARLKFNPHIIYAGTGEMVASLKQRIAQYGIIDRVHFLGFVPKENINEIMALSDIYVIASDFEGTSVSLLEAMYNGKLIIASNAPGIKDTITPNECLMFPIKDAKALKVAIVSILNDENLRMQLSTNAKHRYFELYNYDNVVENYLKILNC